MKKGVIALLVIAAVALLLYGFFQRSYNSMVRLDEGVKAQWAQVESQYQRRADLVPNLVNTVKGYAAHESQTFEAVTEARAKATQTTLQVDQMDDASLARFSQAQGELSSALSRLLVVAENYPDLKANQNFRDLQTQLEGTENRIAVERQRFNESVQAYNVYIKQFPRNLVAGMFNFAPKSFFAADPAAATAPVVDFS